MSRAIIAVKTTDSFWHPVWEKYYLPHFDHAEVIPLDSRKYVPGMATWKHITTLINASLVKMLKDYDLVCVADIDEILVPDPDKYQDFGDYMDRFTGKHTRAIGYNIVQDYEDEPIDLSKRITDQRTMWSRDRLYDKPVLTRESFLYKIGQHNCTKLVQRDEDLILFHLRDADRQAAWDRKRTNVKGYEERYSMACEIPEKWRVI